MTSSERHITAISKVMKACVELPARNAYYADHSEVLMEILDMLVYNIIFEPDRVGPVRAAELDFHTWTKLGATVFRDTSEELRWPMEERMIVEEYLITFDK